MASKSSKPEKGTTSSIIPFANFAPPQSLESMEKIMSTSKDQFEKFKSEATESSKQGMEAFSKSGALLTKGMEEYFKTIASITQASLERQGEAFKSLLACKTLNEVTEAQNKMAKDNFEELMQAATKLSEITIKLTTEVMEPINEEVSKNVKKASEAVAA